MILSRLLESELVIAVESLVLDSVRIKTSSFQWAMKEESLYGSFDTDLLLNSSHSFSYSEFRIQVVLPFCLIVWLLIELTCLSHL